MSRIGRKPIEVPSGVNVSISPGLVTVSGPLGELQQQIPNRISVEQENGELLVKRPTDRGPDRALHGLARTLVANMVEGVTKGFEKRLEIQGVGYRAALRGTTLELNVGFSHSGHDRAARRASSSRCPRRPRSWSRAPTSSRWARSPPTSGASARPSRTRARASATRASTCAEKSGSEHDRRPNQFSGCRGTSRFPRTPSTGPLARTGGCAAGKRA